MPMPTSVSVPQMNDEPARFAALGSDDRCMVCCWATPGAFRESDPGWFRNGPDGRGEFAERRTRVCRRGSYNRRRLVATRSSKKEETNHDDSGSHAASGHVQGGFGPESVTNASFAIGG